jgi:hypothetical protein
LSGNYLKSLQLAKQLEERAKEATRNREIAEKEHDALERFLEECRDNDVDLGEVEKPQRDFEAAIASKDYQSGIAHSRKGMEIAKGAYLRKIGDVADSVDGLINLVQGTGNESKTAHDMLEKSKERVVADDLEGAMKLAKSAYDAAERTFHEVFSKLFSQAQETIMQAKEFGNDVTIFDDQLARAKSALESQEYEACMTEIKEVLEGAGEDLKSQVNSAVSKAEELISAGEELGADMSRVRAHTDKSKSALTALKFKEALSYAKKAESEGESAISTRFQDMARETREAIKKMKNAKEDVTAPQALLDQAVNALKDKKYIEALHALNTAHEKMHKVEFDSVLEVISKARDRFVLAKKVGVDMTKAILLLNTSRDNLKLGKFEEAMSYAEQSWKEVDTALEMFYTARDEVVELAKAVKFASELGADTTKTKAALADARKHFESKNYEKTAEVTSEGLAATKKLIYDRVMKEIDVADKALKLSKEIGADIAEAEGILQKALDSMSKEDMMETVNLAKSSKEAANAAMTRVMSDRLQNIDQFVKGYTSDEPLSELSETITQARRHIASSEFDKAQGLIKQVTQRIESIGQVECDKLIATATSKIAMIKSMEGDASDVEILLTRANEALSNRVYEDVTAHAREIIQSSNVLMNKLIQTEFSAVKDSLEEAKTVGIDIDEARSQLKEAVHRAEEQDFGSAFKSVRGIRESLQNQIARFDQVKDKIHKTEELISEASKIKADVTPLIRKLDEARGRFSDGKLDDAMILLDELIAETERSLGMYLAAKLILSSKENIELAQMNGIEAGPASELLGKAKDFMKTKNYDQALATAKECDELARQTISTSISEMIRSLRRLLTDARNVGVDTLGPEKLSEKAGELARAGDFVEALRCINSAKEDINHVKSLSSQAALEIRLARSNLKDAETLDMDVGRARELLEQAVEALTRHQYAIALELARKSSEASSEITKSRIWGTLEKLKNRIEKSASEGLQLGMAERYVAEGIQAYNETRYQDSLKLAMQCETEMERAELQRDISTRAVEMARRKLLDATSEGTRTDHLTESVERAERLLSEGKYVDAMTAAIESGDELHVIGENLDSCRIELSAVRERVERLKRVEIDTSECDEMLDMAQDYLTAHEFAKSRDALKRATAKSESLFEDSIRDVMEQNRLMIAKAKAMGIDTKAAEDLLEVAKTSFNEKLWDFAYQQALACKDSSISLVSKKISSLIDDVETKTEGLRKLGASVTMVEKSLDEARKAQEEGDTEGAFQLLMDADRKTMGLEDSYKKYLDISIAAESAIENLGRHGLSRKEPERLIAMAEIEKEKDYDSAIELVAEALDTAKDLMEEYSSEITGSISGIGLQEAVESDLTINIKNNGKAPARDVSAEVIGDFDVVEAGVVATLKPNAEQQLNVKLVPRSSGNVPIKVKLTSRRQVDGRPQTVEIEDSLNIFPAGPPFRIGRASETTRCISCQGRVKPGFDIVTCRCGGQLHLSCAKRTGGCPVCGQKYSF